MKVTYFKVLICFASSLSLIACNGSLLPPIVSNVDPCATSIPGDGVVSYPVDANPLGYNIVDRLYQRPEGMPVNLVGTNDGVANRYVEPFPGSLGGKYLLFFYGDHVTLKGQGYFRARWEIAYFNRGGEITPDMSPEFAVKSGTLKKVALANRYMPDYDLNGTPGKSGVWRPGTLPGGHEYDPITTAEGVTAGVPSLWGNEYYYLDGEVTINQREGWPDYNLALTPVSWAGVSNDLLLPVRGSNNTMRPGVSLDPYNGITKPASPAKLVASAISSSQVNLAWTDCSSNENGYLVEYSYAGNFGQDPYVTGKDYALGQLYTNGETIPANSKSLELATLLPNTKYLMRVHAYNDAGNSAYSNVVEVTTPAAGNLSTPWAAQDIVAAPATMTSPGSSNFDNGKYTLRVGSGDLWNSSDSFHFAFQPLRGNGTITARVVDLGYTHRFAKAGVMMRETLAPDSPYAMTRIQAIGDFAGQFRQTTAGSTNSEGRDLTGQSYNPYWVRLSRKENVFTMQGSLDGITWVTFSVRNIVMTEQIYVGLAVASISSNFTTSTFDHVTLTTP
jgi:regulation of enolase protein 1 (concanavalin A-like superfamily)